MSKLIDRRKLLLDDRDTKGKMVLDYAIEEKMDTMVEILLKSDSSLAYQHDKDGFTALHKAAIMGSLSMIQIILELSPQSITLRDERYGRTALHVVKMDDLHLEECLSNTRMKELINEVDDDGNTPLHLALINADQATAEKLLEVHGINWKLMNKQGHSPMDLCISDGKVLQKLKHLETTSMIKDGMEILFHKDVVYLDDVLNQYTWEEFSTYRGVEGDNIFHVAAREGNMKVIKTVSNFNSDNLLILLGKNSKGETPLHLAAHHGHLEVVNYILERGSGGNQLADLPWRMKSNNGDTPAHKALREKHVSIALHLLRVDPELMSFTNKANESLLYLSANSGCYAVLSHILSEDRDYVTSGVGAQNVLHAAARTEGVSFCKNLMIKQPHLLRMVDSRGRTPLHCAVEYNMHGEIKLLLKQDKYSAFVYDNEGFTPLLRAANLGYVICVRSILELCPHSATLRDLNNNKTVLHLANFLRSPLNFLMNREVLGKLINEVDNDGNTALHCAILDRNAGKALLLLKAKGINWSLRNKENQSPQNLCEKLLESGETVQLPVAIALSNLSSSASRKFSTKCISSVGAMFPYPLRISLDPDYEMAMSEERVVKYVDNIAVVTVLLLIIVVARIFAIPGGYYQNTGEAMRMKEVSVMSSLSWNVLAMLICFSILTRYALGVYNGKTKRLMVNCAMLLLGAIFASLVALLSG